MDMLCISTEVRLRLACVGAFVVTFVVLKLLLSIWRGVYTCRLSYLLRIGVDWKKTGRWAVITGATDGLGKAYAEQLASRGLDIVLISRNPEKLKTVSKDIEEVYNVEVKTITVDFTGGPEIYQTIKEELKGLEIGVLVNNVGMSYDHAEYLLMVDDGLETFEQLILTNAMACTMMMKIILPQMEERRNGVIINLSSLLALSPMPLLCVYAACKVYVDYLSRGIQQEYRKKGIIIQSVLPGFVATKMSKIKKTNLEVPSPEKFVEWAIRTVGVEDCTYGYPAHKLRGYVHEWLKTYLPVPAAMSIAMNSMKAIRTRYYKKLSKRNIGDKNN